MRSNSSPSPFLNLKRKQQDTTMDEKKKFRETKVGQWLKKAGQKLPEIASVALEVATGDIAGAADKITDILNEKANADKEAAKLKVEWEKYLLEFQKELTQMELADRQDARAREVAFVNATGAGEIGSNSLWGRWVSSCSRT